jgi:hypothetical protein
MNLDKDIRLSIRAQAVSIIAIVAVWYLLLWVTTEWVDAKVFNHVPNAFLWAGSVIFFCFPFISALWALILSLSFLRPGRRDGWWVCVAAVATISVWLYILSLNHWTFSRPGPEMIYW